MRYWPILAALTGVTLGVLIMTKKAEANEREASLDSLFEKWGDAYGVDPLLLKAHATVESGLDPSAINPADPSYGLMQVLCTGSLKNPEGRCLNRFNIDGWAGMTAVKLLDPETNIKMAAQIVRWNVDTFGMPRAVAVYNRWDQRTAPQAGPFANQRYVDKVLAEYRRLGGDA